MVNRGTNLHAMWDSQMMQATARGERPWLARLERLDTDENKTRWSRGTVEDWAQESFLAARAAYKVPGTDKKIKSGEKLGQSYADAHLATLERRLTQAGFRIALELNAALANDE
jgi:hypothetical protein